MLEYLLFQNILARTVFGILRLVIHVAFSSLAILLILSAIGLTLVAYQLDLSFYEFLFGRVQ